MTVAATRRRRAERARRGIALLTALVAILLVALLSIGAMHLALGDFRRTRDEGTMRRAANVADAGAYDVLRRWATSPHEATPVGQTLPPDSLQLTGASAVARTTRASRTTWWTVSTGSAGDSIERTLSRRTVQMAYRLALPDVVANAALVVRDSVTLAGGARVVGSDTALAAWGALCPSLTQAAGLAMADTTRLCDGTCGAGSVGGRVQGFPPLLVDASAALAPRYRVFGGETWASLTAHASVVLPPGSVVTPSPVVAAGVCDRTRIDNWGDPGGVGVCGTYAPLIWATGDVVLRGGAGQGVLLVEGDLTVSQGARFAGVVIVRDDVQSQGIGGTVLGAVLAGDANVAPGDHTRLDGATLVQRSRCAVDLALEWSARLVPVRQRAWAPFR
ncbi:MAG: hypothetical protein KBF56_09290 [Gemmatimonadaceae bacterium]|nr:hypothetical protein [Gemmatimonadaceae bacterium]